MNNHLDLDQAISGFEPIGKVVSNSVTNKDMTYGEGVVLLPPQKRIALEELFEFIFCSNSIFTLQHCISVPCTQAVQSQLQYFQGF